MTQNGYQPEMVAQQSAYEEVLIGKIFDQVFGSSGARVRPIMAAFAVESQVATWQLQFIQQNYGAPSPVSSGHPPWRLTSSSPAATTARA